MVMPRNPDTNIGDSEYPGCVSSDASAQLFTNLRFIEARRRTALLMAGIRVSRASFRPISGATSIFKPGKECKELVMPNVSASRLFLFNSDATEYPSHWLYQTEPPQSSESKRCGRPVRLERWSRRTRKPAGQPVLGLQALRRACGTCRPPCVHQMLRRPGGLSDEHG